MDDETVLPPDDRRVRWGSDAIAAALRATGVPYVALNPGASYRGLHDSLVNFLGNERPQMLLCLHEEHAVAIAHGYAKVTDRPMAAAVHSNVGLMHATMAVFNAYCDRAPLLLLGATGPVDAARRRPWIDWIHTAADQAALVRPYIKWDDQPASVPASVAALLRANQLTRTYPAAPVYVCFDAAVQEEPFDRVELPDASRYAPIADSAPAEQDVTEAVRLLAAARRPVLLAGRAGRDQSEWDDRVRLAERLPASVVTDLKVAAAFPTDHPLHHDTPGMFLSQANRELIRSADVILALDWVDLGGTLRQAFGDEHQAARVIAAGADHQLFNGWSKNDHVLAPVDVWLHSRPKTAVAALLARLPEHPPSPPPAAPAKVRTAGDLTGSGSTFTVDYLAATLRKVTADLPVTLIRTPIAWNASYWDLTEPLDFLGFDGGGGVGSGPGIAVGAALALKDSGRLPVAVLGDGDYLMGLTALWTAARYRLPLLVVVANNGSFYNDEVHQERVARIRDRPLRNAHVGLRITDPAPDLAALARGQGLEGIGPVASPDDLAAQLDRAVRLVRSGRPTVVDVAVERGYGAGTAGAIAPSP